MTKRVLVDAGPLIALINRDDQDHDECVATMKKLPAPLLTTRMPVAEAMHLFNSSSFVAAAIGGAVGVALGFYAVAQTKFEATQEGRFYTPNAYIGLGVSALLIGRIIYRLMVVYPTLHSAVQQAAAQNPGMQGSPLAALQRSPLTLGIYFVLAGYYICYYLNVIFKGHTLTQPDSAEKHLEG